jgi:hypothetical protein
MAGNQIDLFSEPPGDPFRGERRENRNFVGIHFTCCDVYARIYKTRDETAYAGHCPRCSRSIRLRIGPGGTNNRFFTAS